MTTVLSLAFSTSLLSAPGSGEGSSPSYTCPALNLPSSSPIIPNAQPHIPVEPSERVSRKPGGVQVRWEGSLRWYHSQVPTSIIVFKGWCWDGEADQWPPHLEGRGNGPEDQGHPQPHLGWPGLWELSSQGPKINKIRRVCASHSNSLNGRVSAKVTKGFKSHRLRWKRWLYRVSLYNFQNRA